MCMLYVAMCDFIVFEDGMCVFSSFSFNLQICISYPWCIYLFTLCCLMHVVMIFCTHDKSEMTLIKTYIFSFSVNPKYFDVCWPAGFAFLKTNSKLRIVSDIVCITKLSSQRISANDHFMTQFNCEKKTNKSQINSPAYHRHKAIVNFTIQNQTKGISIYHRNQYITITMDFVNYQYLFIIIAWVVKHLFYLCDTDYTCIIKHTTRAQTKPEL